MNAYEMPGTKVYANSPHYNESVEFITLRSVAEVNALHEAVGRIGYNCGLKDMAIKITRDFLNCRLKEAKVFAEDAIEVGRRYAQHS